MRGIAFHAADDARLVSQLHKDAGSPITVVKSGVAPSLIYARVNENRAAFSLKVGSEFLDTMEGKAALFYMSDAAYKSIPQGAALLHGGERWLVSAEIEENRQGIVVERIVLCDGGLFPHLCDVYSETTEKIAGKPQPPTYTLLKANQRCYFEFTPNVDEPTGMGRDNSANFFTRDTCHFPYDANVQNAGWLIDRTPVDRLNPGSAQANSYGKISRVQGAPQYTHPSHLRRIGKFTVNSMVDEHPPVYLVEQI